MFRGCMKVQSVKQKSVFWQRNHSVLTDRLPSHWHPKWDILSLMNSAGEFPCSYIKKRKPSNNTRTKDSLINAIWSLLTARRLSGTMPLPSNRRRHSVTAYLSALGRKMQKWLTGNWLAVICCIMPRMTSYCEWQGKCFWQHSPSLQCAVWPGTVMSSQTKLRRPR